MDDYIQTRFSMSRCLIAIKMFSRENIFKNFVTLFNKIVKRPWTSTTISDVDVW